MTQFVANTLEILFSNSFMAELVDVKPVLITTPKGTDETVLGEMTTLEKKLYALFMKYLKFAETCYDRFEDTEITPEIMFEFIGFVRKSRTLHDLMWIIMRERLGPVYLNKNIGVRENNIVVASTSPSVDTDSEGEDLLSQIKEVLGI